MFYYHFHQLNTLAAVAMCKEQHSYFMGRLHVYDKTTNKSVQMWRFCVFFLCLSLSFRCDVAVFS